MSEVILPIDALVQYGIVGVVLAWFMWRNEKVITKLADTQEQLVLKISQLCQTLQQKTEGA